MRLAKNGEKKLKIMTNKIDKKTSISNSQTKTQTISMGSIKPSHEKDKDGDNGK